MTEAPKRILSFGEILWDLLPQGRRLGGAALNFAYRAHELGERVGMVSRLGEDDLGREAQALLESLELALELVQWDRDHPTGTVEVTYDAEGAPHYTILPGVAYDAIQATPEALRWAEAADCCYFGTLAQRRPASRAACRQLLEAARKAVKLVDLNLRRDCYTPTVVAESLALADVAKLSEEEASQLPVLLGGVGGTEISEVIPRVVDAYRLQCCVVTLGARGALAFSPVEGWVRAPGYRMAQADPLGAGDAFAAAFVHRYLRGAGLAECCAYGNAMGALAVRQPGGTAPIAAGEVVALAAQRGTSPS